MAEAFSGASGVKVSRVRCVAVAGTVVAVDVGGGIGDGVGVGVAQAVRKRVNKSKWKM